MFRSFKKTYRNNNGLASDNEEHINYNYNNNTGKYVNIRDGVKTQKKITKAEFDNYLQEQDQELFVSDNIFDRALEEILYLPENKESYIENTHSANIEYLDDSKDTQSVRPNILCKRNIEKKLAERSPSELEYIVQQLKLPFTSRNRLFLIDNIKVELMQYC